MRYRRNFKSSSDISEPAIDLSSYLKSQMDSDSDGLPSSLILFFLLDYDGNAVFMEPQTNMSQVEALKDEVLKKGLGYMVMQGDSVIEKHLAQPQVQSQLKLVANPNEREPIDMSYGADALMAKSQLQSIARIASELNQALVNQDRLPQWVHTKVSTALDRLSTAYNYLKSRIEDRARKSNPTYLQNGTHMCVIAWLSAHLLVGPMTIEEIYMQGEEDGWDTHLIDVALQTLLDAKAIRSFKKGNKTFYLDSDMYKKTKINR
jgi:hypothetical protein